MQHRLIFHIDLRNSLIRQVTGRSCQNLQYVEEPDRWIDIGIKYSKGRLLIRISNAFDGTILRNAEGIVTRKADKKNHGLGIKSVETTLEKYDGALQIIHEGQKFEAKVLMYL